MKQFLMLLIAISSISCNTTKKEESQKIVNSMENENKTTHPEIVNSKNNFGQATMLIRKPVSEVFDAFINPEKTTKFWFTKSTGKLVEGNSVNWIWDMYNLSIPVKVKEIVEHERILIEWGEGSNRSFVEWTFKSIDTEKTFVTITNSGLQGQGDALINSVRDSTGGFTIVLAGLKAYLEHGIELNLIKDKFPK